MNDNAQHKNYEHDIFNVPVSFQMCYSLTRLCSLMPAVEECQMSCSMTNVCTAAMVFAMKTKSIKISFFLTKSCIFASGRQIYRSRWVLVYQLSNVTRYEYIQICFGCYYITWSVFYVLHIASVTTFHVFTWMITV
jgi:hypothetical protein